MPLTLRPNDPRLTWQGSISLEITDEWVMPWRIPYLEKDLFPPDDGLPLRASMAAGVRISFRSNTTSLAGAFIPCPETPKLDLYCDGKPAGSLELGGKHAFEFNGLPHEEKLIELWLPQLYEFRLKSLEVDDGATLQPFKDDHPKWITYGSSISHCGAAESPSQTWPAIVARERGLNLTCLGFGGQCHLDPMIARMIRDLPADFISIKSGINVYGANSLGPRAFKPALIGTVKTIREKHPETPIALISSIFSPERETTPNAAGFTLQQMRDEVEDAVRRLRKTGDRNVHYFNGLDLLGPDLVHRMPNDGVHPDAEGYKLIARNFLEKIIPHIFP